MAEQFQNSLFPFNSLEIATNFKIEMQRYFQFKEDIILSKWNASSILVEHPVIMDNELAQSIKVKELIINHYGKYEKQPNRIEYIEPGKAVLHFNTPWQDVSVKSAEGDPDYLEIPENNVYSISITVSIPDYQGSESDFSNSQDIKMR